MNKRGGKRMNEIRDKLEDKIVTVLAGMKFDLEIKEDRVYLITDITELADKILAIFELARK